MNGAHELLTPETLCCQALHRNNGMTDGQKLLESEKMDCRGAGLAQDDFFGPAGFVGPAGFDDIDGDGGSCGFDSFDGPKLTVGILKTFLQLAATPRNTNEFKRWTKFLDSETRDRPAKLSRTS